MAFSEAYERFLALPDKEIEIDGRTYFRIVGSAVLPVDEHGSMALCAVLSPDMPRKSELYVDENGNRFLLDGFFPFDFGKNTPEWYYKCGASRLKCLDSEKIGDYLGLF